MQETFGPIRYHDDGKPDERYSMAYEYLGYSVPQIALRFCGELIGVPNGIMSAKRIADDHYNTMMGVN